MNHAEHWHPVVRRLADGREIEVREYQYPAEEIELRQAAAQQSTGSIEELNVRLGLQKALQEPEKLNAGVCRARSRLGAKKRALAGPRGSLRCTMARARRGDGSRAGRARLRGSGPGRD